MRETHRKGAATRPSKVWQNDHLQRSDDMSGRSVAQFAIGLSLLSATLSGCKHYWGKPGATAEQFNRDTTDCAKEASAPQLAAVESGERIYRGCMRAHGWARDKRPVSDPGEGWFRGIESWK
jgi:hypothetical protein